MTDIASDIPENYLKLSQGWLRLLSFTAIMALVLVTLLGASISYLAPLWLTLPLLVAFVFACVMGMVLLRSMEWTRDRLHERAWQWGQNQETARSVAIAIVNQQILNVKIGGKNNLVSVGGDVNDQRPIIVSKAPQFKVVGVDGQELIEQAITPQLPARPPEEFIRMLWTTKKNRDGQIPGEQKLAGIYQVDDTIVSGYLDTLVGRHLLHGRSRESRRSGWLKDISVERALSEFGYGASGIAQGSG